MIHWPFHSIGEAVLALMASFGRGATEQFDFEGPENDEREAAIVRRLIASGPLSVVVLGGAHDLSKHVRRVADAEYLRVFVDGYPAD